MVCQRRIDVNEVDERIAQNIFVALVSRLDPKRVPNSVEGRPRSPADRVHVHAGITLVNGNELRAEAKADDRDVQLDCFHQSPPSSDLVGPPASWLARQTPPRQFLGDLLFHL